MHKIIHHIRTTNHYNVMSKIHRLQAAHKVGVVIEIYHLTLKPTN